MSDSHDTAERNFIASFEAIAQGVHDTAVDKGWWDNPRNDGEIIALIHSELSEALEGLRHDDPPDSHVPQYSTVEVELSDVLVRIMDFAHARGYRVAEALIAKIRFNRTREKMHGGKRF